MLKKNNLFLFALLSFLSFACSSVSTDDLIIDDNPSNGTITYTANVKTIIDQSCAVSGCHNSNGNAAGLIMETFDQVRNAVMNRGVISRMESTIAPMPASGNLPQPTIDIIKSWKDQGYLN